MNTNDTLIENLIQLSDLDFSKRRMDPKSAQCIEITLEALGVRKRLPATVLNHYDVRISRGKRGAARMRNTTCGGCNLALPSGQLADLRHENAELQLCCNCSIYLLPSLVAPVDPAAAPAVAKAVPVAVAKKVAVKKPRKVKVKVEAEAAAEAEVEDVEPEAEAAVEEEVVAEAAAAPQGEAEAATAQQEEVEAEAEVAAAPQEDEEAEAASKEEE